MAATIVLFSRELKVCLQFVHNKQFFHLQKHKILVVFINSWSISFLLSLAYTYIYIKPIIDLKTTKINRILTTISPSEKRFFLPSLSLEKDSLFFVFVVKKSGKGQTCMTDTNFFEILFTQDSDSEFYNRYSSRGSVLAMANCC